MMLLQKTTFYRTFTIVLLSVFSISCTERGQAIYGQRKTGLNRLNMEKASSKGFYKVGTPYQVNNAWYHPEENYSYKDTGIASWYGSDFHNKVTANGEIFDMNSLTAAHKTLPLPSIVRVTNLENGRSLLLRVNDRGPFVNNRIIDVSRRASQLLGFQNRGTARVKVEVLPEESRELKRIALGTDKELYSPLYKEMVRNGLSDKGSLIPRIKGSYPTENIVVASLSEPKDVLQQQALKKEETISSDKTSETTVSMPASASWFVQAGAFSDYSNAVRLSTKLSSVGSTSISPISIGDKTLHRVRVGPVKNIEEARVLIEKVRTSGSKGATLIKPKQLQK